MDITKYVVKSKYGNKHKHKYKGGDYKIITNTNTTECMNPINGVCIPNNVLPAVKEYANSIGINNINDLKKKINCNTDLCVLEKTSENGFLSKDNYNKIIVNEFKPQGPKYNTDLLNNFNIDDTLMLWANDNKISFYPCPFSMIDFDIVGNKFGKINLVDVVTGKESYKNKLGLIIKKPFNTFGCVLNTDVSTGRGKHWVCIFADFRHKNEWSIEYFNSAGNMPDKRVIIWMETQRNNLLKIHNNVITVSVTTIAHQNSMTECGPYALYYIRARLDNISYTHFMNNSIPDSAMIEFRKHIFR